MKIRFNINYRTQWGEAVYITGNTPELGNDNESIALPLQLTGIESWTCEVEFKEAPQPLTFRFFVKSDSGTVRREWGSGHELMIADAVQYVEVESQWQNRPDDKHYYSSAFINAINARTVARDTTTINANTLYFSVQAPHIKPNEKLAITGDTEALGNWNPNAAIILNDHNFPTWTIAINLDKLPKTFQYKFIIVDSDKNAVAWEGGDNRKFQCEPYKKGEAVAVDGLRYYDVQPNWRGAGVAIPVFSLRSENDFGVGDFYDLFKMIDWAAETGQNFVQILPINDTTMTGTWTDSYPYNANSTFALHPMYLRIEAVGEIADKAKSKKYAELKAELNALACVDYERVNNAKQEYLKEIYEQKGKEDAASKEYKEFVSKNEYWLKPYATFCVLRDIYGTTDYTRWEDMKVYDSNAVDKFAKQHNDAIGYVYFLQYHLDKQLRAVRDYAHSKRVVLKGDIPIGISRTSADAWTNPRLFNLDCQAGAPPDDFSVLGQNWGFPTYNWEEMSKDGFQWWKNRFKKMAEYFDAYRIDHILGFFRIWEIPMDAVHGLLGTFNPALPYSTDELRRQYDFWFNSDLYTRPYIMDYFLHDFFGEYTEEVKRNFLNPCGNGRYELKPKFATQRQIVDFFNAHEQTGKNEIIKNALMGLVDEVLFIEDKEKKGHYHPRISAQYTYIYKSLNDYQRECFDRLYNDFFYRRHNEFWYGKAMWKLPPLINSTKMLVCGEDLGMIPACVPAVMDTLKILALEIQRMPKNPNEEFANPLYYPYLSVAATSTHDMSGIRAWWEENREATQRFYNQMLHENGNAPYYAEPWICQKIVDMHLESPSMLTILPLQDWLSTDGEIRRENPQEEQINIPANSRHYWKYRMHLTLEQLLSASNFNQKMRDKIQYYGR